MVAATVIGATVGVGWLLIQDNNNSGISVDASLEVFGNANGDTKIDHDDIAIIQDIIDGKKSFEDYPLADANNDGKVDEADIEQVLSIMNATPQNPVRIHIVNHTTDVGGAYVTDVMYPISSAVATAAANSLLNLKYLGIVDELKGFSFNASGPDANIMFKEYASLLTQEMNYGITTDGTSANYMNFEKVLGLKNTEGVSAIITADNRSYIPNEDAFKAADIDVIRVKAAAPDPDEYFSALLMIAFLFDTGQGYLEKCYELIIWYMDFLADLEKRLEGVTNKVKAVTSSTTGFVSTGPSEYINVLLAAGAEYGITNYQNLSAASTRYDDGVWVANYQIDCLISMRASPSGSSWYGGTAPGSSLIPAMFTQFSLLEVYHKNNVWVICGDMPVVLRIAYSAEILYPELFEEGWADALHIDYAERFLGFDADFMEGKKFALSMSDVGLSTIG